MVPDYTPAHVSTTLDREDSAALGGDGLAFKDCKGKECLIGDNGGLTAPAVHVAQNADGGAQSKRVSWADIADIWNIAGSSVST